MRTSFFVEPHPGVFEHLVGAESGQGVEINGLVAAKHTRDVRRVVGGPETAPDVDNLSIEWYDGLSRLAGLPFDPPLRAGMLMMVSLESSPEAAVDVAAAAGVRFDANRFRPVATDDYWYWYVPADEAEISGVLEKTKTVEGGGARVVGSLRWSYFGTEWGGDAGVVCETWSEAQAWSGFVPAGALKEASEETSIELAGVGTLQIVHGNEMGVFTLDPKVHTVVVAGRVRSERSLAQIDAAGDSRAGALDGERFGEPMMLRWYPRHQRLGSSRAVARIETPYGLHPQLKLEMQLTAVPALPQCQLYMQLDLPSDLFLDQYELRGILPNMDPPAALLALSGDNDLEKPVWQAEAPVSGVFRLGGSLADANRTFTIPMHFRYQLPDVTELLSGNLPEPHVFFACANPEVPQRAEEFLEPREALGIEAAFPLDTTQFFVVPSNTVMYRIPTISPEVQGTAERVTMVAVILGAAVVLLAVLAKLWGPRAGPTKAKKEPQVSNKVKVTNVTKEKEE